MPTTYALDGDRTGLPKTRRTGIPFEVEALTPKEAWGAGNSNTTFNCKTEWETAATWVKEMVGEVQVVKQSSQMLLRRFVPEMNPYNDVGDGSDSRVQFCSICDQIDQYGTEIGGTLRNIYGWPQTDWYRSKAVFEAFPYAILDNVPLGTLPAIPDIAAAAGAYAGATELYRYVVRKRRYYTKEQPVPGPNAAANLGFFVVDGSVPKKAVPGAVLFRNIGFGDITLRWVRVPVGWPPTVGYLGTWPPTFNPAAVDPTTKYRTRDSFQGTVNDDWFDVAAADGICAPPETLLYTGYSDDNKYYDAAGDWVCDVDFFFKYKGGADASGVIRGWNHCLSANGIWVPVTSDVIPGDMKRGTVNGQKPYKTNDFDNLFRWS